MTSLDRIILTISEMIRICDEKIEQYAQGGQESHENWWHSRRAALRDTLGIVEAERNG